MLKISRQEINDVIKSARHPNAGKLAHDYALPLPERQFGEPLKSSKGKWIFDAMPKPKGTSDLKAWIDRSKRYDDMKTIQPLTLIEQKKEEIQKEKKDESKKVQLLEQLLNRLGIVGPAPAPAPVVLVGASAPGRPMSAQPLGRAVSPGRGVSPGPVVSSSRTISPGRVLGGTASPLRVRFGNQTGLQQPIPVFSQQVNPQQFTLKTEIPEPEPEPAPAPEITEIPTVVDWDNKKLRSDIAVVLRDEYNYKGGTANIEKIIEWYKQNPQFVPKFFSVSNVKDSFTTSKIPLGKLGLTKK